MGMVRNGGSAMPGAIPDAVVAEIRRREAEGEPRPKELGAGGIARIKGGPLDDRFGLCVRVSDTRAMVLLSMFGTERTIQFARDMVEAA
jgi:hypothetical protein